MSRRSKNKTLTEKEQLFVNFHEGNDTKAARLAKFRNPGSQGPRVAKRPQVAAALRAKHAAMVTESGKQQARAISVTRNDIINGLAEIGLKGKSESAQVSALSKLADIFELSPKNVRDRENFFRGWSDEELVAFVATGAVPLRFGAALSASRGEEDPSGTSTRKAN